jgi:hypothetical protein
VTPGFRIFRADLADLIALPKAVWILSTCKKFQVLLWNLCSFASLDVILRYLPHKCYEGSPSPLKKFQIEAFSSSSTDICEPFNICFAD